MSPELKEQARRMREDYERRIEMIWDDMLFEFEMRNNLTTEEAEEYFYSD